MQLEISLAKSEAIEARVVTLRGLEMTSCWDTANRVLHVRCVYDG